LGSALGSIDSAGTEVPLFADFTATIAESDFSMPGIIGYGFPFLCVPATTAGWHGDLPGPGAVRTYVPWVLRHRGIPAPLAISVDWMLPSARWKTSASRTRLFRCSIAPPARAPVNA